jgi:hypothetical protein
MMTDVQSLKKPDLPSACYPQPGNPVVEKIAQFDAR